MTGLELALVFGAAVLAGAINAVVGSGTLVTFPALLAVGIPPTTANVSNSIGLFPGAVSAAWAYRRELRGQRERLVRLGCGSLAGGAAGAALLLVLPDAAFSAIVPALVALAVALVALQARINAWLHQRRPDQAGVDGHALWALVAAAGVYGGYFGAAQGVLLMAVLGLSSEASMQRNNAAKNALSALVNGVAALLFIVTADVHWGAVAVVAAGSVLGAAVGAGVGRQLSPAVLRAAIIVIGLVALVHLGLT